MRINLGEIEVSDDALRGFELWSLTPGEPATAEDVRHSLRITIENTVSRWENDHRARQHEE